MSTSTTPPPTSTQHTPDGPWVFDQDVTAVFEDMIARSVPGYQQMRDVVTSLASRFRSPGGYILDLGASLGGASSQLIRKWGAHNRFVLCEYSEPMLAELRDRFAGYIDADVVEVRRVDLRRGIPPLPASVMLCVLTMQFIPVEYRAHLLRQAYEVMPAGGAFILAEKVIAHEAGTDVTLRQTYHDFKRGQGYSDDAVEAKRASLEHQMVPLTAGANEQLLRGAGFREVECVWRHLNFAAWIAIKS